MKKSIAVVLLGSALLLPNNNSVEASYSDNNVQVQKIQQVQCYVGVDKQSYFYDTKPVKRFDNGKRFEWKKSYEKNAEVAAPAPGKKVEQPAPTKPAQTPVTKPSPAQAPANPAETAQDSSVSAFEKAVLDLTNVERQKAGLNPLQTDKNLMTSARQKSSDMASNNYFSHTSPTYGSPFDQMKANGVSYRSAAENIAMGQRSAEEVVQGWMESPGHRENILTPNYTHIGIGYDKNGHYWTQQFIQK